MKMKQVFPSFVIGFVAAAVTSGCQPFRATVQEPVPVLFGEVASTRAFVPVTHVERFSVMAYSDAASVPPVFIDGMEYPFTDVIYWPDSDLYGAPNLDFVGWTGSTAALRRTYGTGTVYTSIDLDPAGQEDLLYFHTFWKTRQMPVEVSFRHVFNRLRNVSFRPIEPEATSVVLESLVMKDYANDASLLCTTCIDGTRADRYEVHSRSPLKILSSPVPLSPFRAERLFVPGTYRFEVVYSLSEYGQSKVYTREFTVEMGSEYASDGGVAYNLDLLLGDDIVKANPVIVEPDPEWNYGSLLTEDFRNSFLLQIISSGSAITASAYSDYIITALQNCMKSHGYSGMEDSDMSMLKDALKTRSYPLTIPVNFPTADAAYEMSAYLDSRISGPPLFVNPEFEYDVCRESDIAY